MAGRRRLLDPSHPFFRPLWRRVALVGFCLGWAAVELAWGSPMWALLTGGIGAFCAWVLLVDFRPGDRTE